MAEKDYGQDYLAKVFKGRHDDYGQESAVADRAVKTSGGEAVNRKAKGDRLPAGERQ